MFAFELTPGLTSLCKDGLMRKAAKYTPRKLFLDNTNSVVDESTASLCVVDGGVLLHKMKWPRNCKFSVIIQAYMEYISNTYGRYSELCVVFDGYFDKSSTKATEHERRRCVVSANINICENMKSGMCSCKLFTIRITV